jgi:hypothetical protein
MPEPDDTLTPECFTELAALRDLPSADLGPVAYFGFARLAASLASEIGFFDMMFSSVGLI